MSMGMYENDEFVLSWEIQIKDQLVAACGYSSTYNFALAISFQSSVQQSITSRNVNWFMLWIKLTGLLVLVAGLILGLTFYVVFHFHFNSMASAAPGLITEEKVDVGGLSLNFAKAGSGSHPVLCLPGTLGQYFV